MTLIRHMYDSSRILLKLNYCTCKKAGKIKEKCKKKWTQMPLKPNCLIPTFCCCGYGCCVFHDN